MYIVFSIGVCRDTSFRSGNLLLRHPKIFFTVPFRTLRCMSLCANAARRNWQLREVFKVIVQGTVTRS